MFPSYIDQKAAAGNPTLQANRIGFGEGLVEAGKRNKDVVALSADLTESTRALAFKEAFPERFVQVGVAEQNLVSVASGMAMMGKVPFVTSYAMFSPGRNWEQIRTTVAYNDANVKIIGAHAGISVGPDGATHQAIEDIALMRIIPNMTVIVPIDSHEAKKATLWAAEHAGPVYIRLARNDTPIVTVAETPFIPGKAELLYGPESGAVEVALLTTGTLGYEAIQAARTLEASGVRVSVYHFATIKPLDTDTIDRLAGEANLLVTIEDHQIAGGFGSAVAEQVTSNAPVRVLRIGIEDRFGQSGEPEELLAEYGCNAAAIVAKVTALRS